MNDKILLEKIFSLGVDKAVVTKAQQIMYETTYRNLCKSNACGKYNKTWVCPPFIGEIEALIDGVEKYEYALVYQKIFNIEDSYDVEGMEEAAEKERQIDMSVKNFIENMTDEDFAIVASPQCRKCERCSVWEREKCKFPESIIPSLSAYGVEVSKVASKLGMKYVNGNNTVTYFGIVYFNK